jgi:hypothetical protein
MRDCVWLAVTMCSYAKIKALCATIFDRTIDLEDPNTLRNLPNCPPHAIDRTFKKPSTIHCAR